jgi:phosphinothricin acetyltransferase
MQLNHDEVSIIRLAEGHWPEVRAIYQAGMDTGNATFETVAPEWDAWCLDHHEAGCLVAMVAGRVAGWAALSPVSRRSAYRGVAEVSVYVRDDLKGRGVGRLLLEALIREAEAAGIWTLQASVFPENHATLRLHAACGFRTVGRRERIGRLHGLWRDTLLLERRSITDPRL